MAFIGIERRSLHNARNAVPGARFGQLAAGFFGSDALMSDAHPDLSLYTASRPRHS
jgi:hypothetical protein